MHVQPDAHELHTTFLRPASHQIASFAQDSSPYLPASLSVKMWPVQWENLMVSRPVLLFSGSHAGALE